MRGIEDAAGLVATMLADQLPAKIAELVDRYNLIPPSTSGDSVVTRVDYTPGAEQQLAGPRVRGLLAVTNDSPAGVLYLLLGAGEASPTNFTDELAPGDYYEYPGWAGEVRGYATAAGAAQLAEFVAAPSADIAGAPNTLTAPALVTASEHQTLLPEEWPAVVVVGLSTLDLRPVDVYVDRAAPAADGTPYRVAGPYSADPAAGATVWAATYRLRVYVYIRGQDFTDTDLARKRLLLAVRELVLLNRDLDQARRGAATIVPSGIVESFSGIEPDVGSRSVGAGYIEFSVKVTDEAAAPTPGADVPDGFLPDQPPPSVRATSTVITVLPADDV